MADASPADTPVAMEASEAIEATATTDSPEALETVAEETPSPKSGDALPEARTRIQEPGLREG